MKAVCWYGKKDIRVLQVPEPVILNPHDAIVEVTATAICGSDLHLYNGFVPTMEKGDILGHEFMGRVVEIGPEVRNLRVGDRVVVGFPIACGRCWHCRREEYSLCDNTNPNAAMAERVMGHSPAGLFGYSHMMGGYAGGQAEYVRVPFAEVGCLRVPDHVTDEQVLFLSDIFPTGWMAAEYGHVGQGDVVAVWGCGPVGQFAIKSAWMMGAERVIAIDVEPYRLRMAAERGGAEVLDGTQSGIVDALVDMTGGRGPDVCIEAVGLEAHGIGVDFAYDRAMQAVGLETDRPVALRQAILACRKGGRISMAGVYGGILDKIPFGAAFNKSLTMKMGQTHVQRYFRPLLERILAEEIDPSFVITHRMPLDRAPQAYQMFAHKHDDCVKVVLTP